MMIITWTNAAQKAAGMRNLSTSIALKHVPAWTRAVADEGWKTIDELAREDTSVMRSSVTRTALSHGGSGTAVAGYGVAGIEAPFYTKFQELGTKPNGKPAYRGGNGKGITAMLSVPAGAKAMEIEASDSGERMMRNIRGEWNAI